MRLAPRKTARTPEPPGEKAQPKQKASQGRGELTPEMFHVEHFAGP